MKKIVLAMAAIATVMSLSSFSGEAKDKIPARYIPVTGVGPAVAGSTSTTALPKKAEKFISKIGGSVASVEREFATGDYDVTLTSGIEIEFNKHGKVIEIDAPDNAVIGSDVVKEVVPHRLYNNLKEMKATEIVNTIETQRDGSYKVEFIGNMVEEALFGPSGDVIAMYYD